MKSNSEKVLKDGELLYFDEFEGRDKLLESSRKSILEAVKLCTGEEISKKLSNDYLFNIHKYVSPDFEPFINRYLSVTTLKKDFLYYSAKLAKNNEK